jgi:hypothetical protein
MNSSPKPRRRQGPKQAAGYAQFREHALRALSPEQQRELALDEWWNSLPLTAKQRLCMVCIEAGLGSAA